MLLHPLFRPEAKQPPLMSLTLVKRKGRCGNTELIGNFITLFDIVSDEVATLHGN